MAVVQNVTGLNPESHLIGCVYWRTTFTPKNRGPSHFYICCVFITVFTRFRSPRDSIAGHPNNGRCAPGTTYTSSLTSVSPCLNFPINRPCTGRRSELGLCSIFVAGCNGPTHLCILSNRVDDITVTSAPVSSLKCTGLSLSRSVCLQGSPFLCCLSVRVPKNIPLMLLCVFEEQHTFLRCPCLPHP